MTPQEKRQARRIVRIARSLESELFDFIEDMQDGQRDELQRRVWPGAAQVCNSMCEKLNMVADLIRNIIQAQLSDMRPDIPCSVELRRLE